MLVCFIIAQINLPRCRCVISCRRTIWTITDYATWLEAFYSGLIQDMTAWAGLAQSGSACLTITSARRLVFEFVQTHEGVLYLNLMFT